jgi:hypothetical protein
LCDPNGGDDLLLGGKWRLFFGIIMYFLPTFPVLELKKTLMACRVTAGLSTGVAEVFQAQASRNVSKEWWAASSSTGSFFQMQTGEFVFAKEAWSSVPASYWMPEIRLAIPLLISPTLPLVWAQWQ